MWDRRSYNDGQSWRCTVKYEGRIPQWPNDVALGVEWDNAERGRHSGELGGRAYFECRVPGAGAFIKGSRAFEAPRTFEEAVEAKYRHHEEFQEIWLSEKKRIETVGVEKAHAQHAQLDRLEAVSLDACLIDRFAGAARFSLARVATLDLSNNLLSDFWATVAAVDALPALRHLRLNGNRFDFGVAGSATCTRVAELDMAATLVTEREIAQVSAAFPGVAELSLAHNRLARVPPQLPRALRSLDLAGNPITSLSGLPGSLAAAYLSGTEVQRIEAADPVPPCLDLRGTRVADWASISQLGARAVTELQLHHASEDAMKERRPFVIARCGALTKLDGSLISDDERRDAELYALSAVARKKHPALPQDVWDRLLQVYPAPVAPPSRSIQGRLISFYVDDEVDPLRIVADAPLYRLHWLVARHTQRSVREFHIAGVTDLPDLEDDAFTTMPQVRDLVEDSQRLQTVLRPARQDVHHATPLDAMGETADVKASDVKASDANAIDANASDA